MVKLRPFQAYLVNKTLAPKILAPPYDVVNTKEARAMAKGNQFSYLHVNKPEIDLGEDIDAYSEKVYYQGRDNLNTFISNNWLIKDTQERFYVYGQSLKDQKGGLKWQYGVVGLSSIVDYENDVIKKHEKTIARKEEDRTKLTDIQNGNVEPVFLTFKDGQDIKAKIQEVVTKTEPYKNVEIEDKTQQALWQIDTRENEFFESAFSKLTHTYVADGHHRTAAAYNVGKRRRDLQIKEKGFVSGNEEFNYFLSILYPSSDLTCMAYNRVIRSLNGLSAVQFLEKIRAEQIDISPLKAGEPLEPQQKHTFNLLLEGQWYGCKFQKQLINPSDPIKSLDVQLLNDLVIDKILDIKDVRTDKRIDFVGGIRGIPELVKRCEKGSGDSVAAFSMHPVTLDELFRVADANQIMPPKCTWFEPKPKSGFIARQFKH